VLAHQSLTIQRTAIEADVDTGLLKAVLRFRPPEGNIRANNAIFVCQDHRECFKEVGDDEPSIPTLTIFEDWMTQPGLGYPSPLSIGPTEQTALGGLFQCSRRMQVFQESVTMQDGDFDPLRHQLGCAGQFPVEIFLIPLIAGGAKQFNRCGGMTVPHRTSNDKGREEHRCNTARKYSFNVPHS